MIMKQSNPLGMSEGVATPSLKIRSGGVYAARSGWNTASAINF